MKKTYKVLYPFNLGTNIICIFVNSMHTVYKLIHLPHLVQNISQYAYR